MKITIEKTPNVGVSKETIDIEQDLGIDIMDWELMTDEEKDRAIDDYINHPDALANECFKFDYILLDF